MFTIADGRESFYQWDLNRQIIVEDPTIKEVHFCNKTDNCSLVVEVEQTTIFADFIEIDVRTANVPNILLQSDFPIRVYAYCGDKYTKVEQVFKVITRSKPSDYIYTETEVKTLENIEERVENIEDRVASLEKSIEQEYDYVGSVEEYGKTGYIAFDLKGGAMVDILVKYLDYVEAYYKALMRITCAESAHHWHTLTVDAGKDYPTHYTEEMNIPEGSSTWYIPFTFAEEDWYGATTVSIYAKGVIDNIDYDLNVRFVDTLPDEAIAISPTTYATEYYVNNTVSKQIDKAKKDIDDETACKYDMLTESRGDKPLQTGTWVCVHTGRLDGFKLLNHNGNSITTHQGSIPAFEFGIVTISAPWEESYWSKFDSDKSGYGFIQCSLIAKVGNEMKCYYWQDSGNGTYYLRDISSTGNGMCWKIG